MQIQVNFDDQRDRNFAKIFGKYLENPNSLIVNSSGSNTFQSTSNLGSQKLVEELVKIKQENESLSAECKRLQDLNLQQANFLQTKETEINDLKKQLKDAKDYESLQSEEAENLKSELNKKDEKLASVESDYKKRIMDMQTDYNKTNDNLRAKNKALERRLEIYEPINLNSAGEPIYYEVKDGSLRQTVFENAKYVGYENNGKITYQFNIEKGPVKEALQNKESDLRPFCDFEVETLDGTDIIHSQWGKGIIHGQYLDIEKKAKIKIVKL